MRPLLAATCAAGVGLAVLVVLRRRRVQSVSASTTGATVVEGGVERSCEDSRRYRSVVLQNGLRVLLVSDAKAEQRAAAAVCVKDAGARTAPVGLVGLAHYLEHMLFLGSEKYPAESHYKTLISMHNGRCNASTSPEQTVFHFEVDAKGFEPVLDVMAQFFHGRPLLDPSAAERELQAVTAEDARNRINDARRALMVLQHSVPGDKTLGATTYGKFGTGNAETLGPKACAAAGVEIRAALLAFRARFYHTDKFSLCLIANSPLDALESLAIATFGVGGSGASGGTPVAEADWRAAEALINATADAAAATDLAHPWADVQNDPSRFPFALHIAPVREKRDVTVIWPMPLSASMHDDARRPAIRLLSHLIGHEGEGSLFAALQAEGLATHVGASQRISADRFCALQVAVGLTPEGEAALSHVLTRVYEYVGTLAAAGVGAEAAAQWEELAAISLTKFVYAERGDAYSDSKTWASRMHQYGAECVLSGGKVLGAFPSQAFAKCLSLLTPSNMILLRESKAVCKYGANAEPAPEDDDEGDGVSIVTPVPPLPPGAQRLSDPYYGVPYERHPIPPTLLADLAAARARGGGTLLHLPEPNRYVTTDFDMVATPRPAPPTYTSPHPPIRTTAPLDHTAAPAAPAASACRLEHWHDTEVSFGKPKATIIASFACPTDPIKRCLLNLWLTLLDQVRALLSSSHLLHLIIHRAQPFRRTQPFALPNPIARPPTLAR